MSVVIESVGETSVFLNEAGSISIFQKSLDDRFEDATILIPVMFVDLIVDALKSVKEQAIP